VFNEVNVDEHPAPADLRARNLSRPGFLLQGHRMDVQEGSGSLQIERVHARLQRRVLRAKPYRPK
jgi:hypothetical protein